ncbi:MAG: hypothetical protein NZ824_04690 [Candidatus Thioglobus sp.]|nr:hypothetical protein [Candidatus Thioglobus sp.]
MIFNIKASLINLFRKRSTAVATPKAIAPDFSDGNCKCCEQIGLDFSGDKQSKLGRVNMNENRTNDMIESIIDKDNKIKNLSQFLHNLGIEDEQIYEVADGVISDIDKNFLIFSYRE